MKFLKGVDGKNYFVNEAEVLYMEDNTNNQSLSVYFKNKPNPVSIKYVVSDKPASSPDEQPPVSSGSRSVSEVPPA